MGPEWEADRKGGHRWALPGEPLRCRKQTGRLVVRSSCLRARGPVEMSAVHPEGKHGLCVEGMELTGELKRQLCAIGWLYNNQGRLLLTPKEELREALKMSTDVADALALTCLDLWHGDDPVMKTNRRAAVSRDEEAEIMSEL